MGGALGLDDGACWIRGQAAVRSWMLDLGVGSGWSCEHADNG